jgi:predicted enzyme related to lactoylglutathione lyase
MGGDGKETGTKEDNQKTNGAQNPAYAVMQCGAETLYGWITHTEFASSDPAATKAWCATVLGWTFKPGFPTPGGEYHSFTYSDKGGGGIRSNNPPQLPGSVPYVHVPDARAAFEKALREGAEETVTFFARHRHLDPDPLPHDDHAIRDAVVPLIVGSLLVAPGHDRRRTGRTGTPRKARS